jgi:hypothetical protein
MPIYATGRQFWMSNFLHVVLGGGAALVVGWVWMNVNSCDLACNSIPNQRTYRPLRTSISHSPRNRNCHSHRGHCSCSCGLCVCVHIGGSHCALCMVVVVVNVNVGFAGATAA